MLDNEEYIVANIKNQKKEISKSKWFMTNEVYAKPMHPLNSLPDWERSEQKDSTRTYDIRRSNHSFRKKKTKVVFLKESSQ